MITDPYLGRRAAVHAALGDPTRLAIVDLLAWGDAAPSEIGERLAVGSNLLAHHLALLEQVGLVTRRRSEGDRRRSYIHLPVPVPGPVPGGVDRGEGPVPAAFPTRGPARVLFVCTANSARSHLAAALWRRVGPLPAASAGTHPAPRIHPGAVAAARRRAVPMPRRRPRRLEDELAEDDLIVTVCDRAHEELAGLRSLHWSVPDPVPAARAAAFDQAVDDLAGRVAHLASRLAGS